MGRKHDSGPLTGAAAIAGYLGICERQVYRMVKPGGWLYGYVIQPDRRYRAFPDQLDEAMQIGHERTKKRKRAAVKKARMSKKVKA